MSTLLVNTIQNASGGSAINVPGAAKAWVNFNGTGTVAIQSSLNVTSLTDNGTGKYTVNFSTAMDNNQYAAVVTIAHTSLVTGGFILASSSLGAPLTKTTTALAVGCSTDGGTYQDPTDFNVIILD